MADELAETESTEEIIMEITMKTLAFTETIEELMLVDHGGSERPQIKKNKKKNMEEQQQ